MKPAPAVIKICRDICLVLHAWSAEHRAARAMRDDKQSSDAKSGLAAGARRRAIFIPLRPVAASGRKEWRANTFLHQLSTFFPHQQPQALVVRRGAGRGARGAGPWAWAWAWALS